MIRINLNASGRAKRKPGFAARAPGRPKGQGSPIAPVFATLFLLTAAGGGAYYYITYVQPAQVDKKAPPPAASALPPPKPRPDSTVKPSSLLRSTMVEGVVKELGNEKEAPVQSRLNTPYAQMSTQERIQYEVLFGRNVFDMFTRNTPQSIRLSSLEIENFQTVTAAGSGPKEMVLEMFVAFKEELGDLVPKRHSHIKDGETPSTYAFTLMCKPSYGLQVSDPFQVLEQVTFKEGLSQHLKNFSRIAGASGFKMSAAPSQLSVDKAGGYRRVVYKAVGMSTYTDFHKFVSALYTERVPCAMKRVSMVPVKDEQVRVTAEILFSVKE